LLVAEEGLGEGEGELQHGGEGEFIIYDLRRAIGACYG
jgi:hypothetical protein